MAKQVVGMTPTTARRVQQLAQRVAPGTTPRAVDTSGRHVFWVTVTGTAISGWYPCRVEVSAGTGGGFVEFDRCECQGAKGQGLIVGERYLGLQECPSADGLLRFRVVVLMPPVGFVRSVVDNVRCDSLGNIVTRYTQAYGPATVAPPTGSNTIEGIVTVDGDPALGREVVVQLDGFEYRVTTDEDGAYQANALPGGTYVVLVVPEPGEVGTIHQTVTVPTTPVTASFSLTT